MKAVFEHGLACLVLLLVAASSAYAETPMRLPVDAVPLSISSADGTKRAEFSIEIARTSEQHSRGLMFRTDLPANGAMLFVFPEEQPRAFWMRNTPTSLDIIYADANGRIVSIAERTVPFSTRPIPSGEQAQYVLEVHAGTSGLLGIAPGDLLLHPEIIAQDSK